MTKETKTEIVQVPQPPDGEPRAIDCWALLELFGHQRIVGRVSMQAVGVACLLRVDVPDLTKNGRVVRPGFTRFYGPGAVYSLTPVTEQAVRSLLPMISGEPVKEWEYQFGAKHRDEWQDEG
jgi:hypothetical protein